MSTQDLASDGCAGRIKADVQMIINITLLIAFPGYSPYLCTMVVLSGRSHRVVAPKDCHTRSWTLGVLFWCYSLQVCSDEVLVVRCCFGPRLS